MSVLLYCVTHESGFHESGTGVAGLPVLSLQHSDIAVLFSKYASEESWARPPIAESARLFHRVLQRAFASGAVIPFRFPTLMQDERELEIHLGENAAEYTSQLRRYENSAQMDVIIDWSDFESSSGEQSGADYLRTRRQRLEELESIATKLQDSVSPFANEWQSRAMRNGKRLVALLDRGALSGFKDRLYDFAVPAGFTVRASGPWPVTEFLELNITSTCGK